MGDLDPHPGCSCEHALDCSCACHAHFCDPAVDACDIGFLPDEGGLTRWGCADCTPGQAAPHLAGCMALGASIAALPLADLAGRPFA